MGCPLTNGSLGKCLSVGNKSTPGFLEDVVRAAKPFARPRKIPGPGECGGRLVGGIDCVGLVGILEDVSEL